VFQYAKHHIYRNREPWVITHELLTRSEWGLWKKKNWMSCCETLQTTKYKQYGSTGGEVWKLSQ